MFVVMGEDRKIRVFNFLTGKLHRVFDEGLTLFTEKQQVKGHQGILLTACDLCDDLLSCACFRNPSSCLTWSSAGGWQWKEKWKSPHLTPTVMQVSSVWRGRGGGGGWSYINFYLFFFFFCSFCWKWKFCFFCYYGWYQRSVLASAVSEDPFFLLRNIILILH